jgi:pimeloyl-ACP methyl ester carboxylesterase
MPFLIRTGYSVIAADNPGYGNSQSPDELGSYSLFSVASALVNIMNHEGISKSIWIGHDWVPSIN